MACSGCIMNAAYLIHQQELKASQGALQLITEQYLNNTGIDKSATRAAFVAAIAKHQKLINEA